MGVGHATATVCILARSRNEPPTRTPPAPSPTTVVHVNAALLSLSSNLQIEFNEMDLQKTAKGMRSKKAPGEDNIPVEIFKNLPTIAWKDITNLFNAMVRTGYIPDKLKKGKVFTIYKGGNDKDIDNKDDDDNNSNGNNNNNNDDNNNKNSANRKK